jgi:hypothetical protein
MFSLSSLSITRIFILGAALHVVVVIALGMSPVLVDFSHTLPEGLLSPSRGGTTDGMGSLEENDTSASTEFGCPAQPLHVRVGVFDLADRCKVKPERWKRTIKEREVNSVVASTKSLSAMPYGCLESGVRAMGTAQLGVSVWSLGRWSKLYGKDSAAGGTSGGGGG